MANTDYQVEILHGSDSLDDWDSFVDASPQGSIFCRSWWLKAVCPDNFQILTLRKDGNIIAGMPLPISRRLGQEMITMPPLTQTLGALLLPPKKTTYEGKLSDEMEVLQTLVSAIPNPGYFSMNCHYILTNWLPFYWAGYRQTTRYTYVIEDLTNLDKVFANFDHSKRKNILKAEKEVTVHENMAPEDFYANHKLTLGKQRQTISYPFELFKQIYDAAIQHHAGKTWYAIDEQRNIHAAIFLIYDIKSAYYLISTIDPDYRNSGAATLLLRDAITYVSKYTKRFDFEGSMIQGVENSFRKFGAIQTPYFNISKDSRPLPIKTGFELLRLVRGGLRKAGIR